MGLLLTNSFLSLGVDWLNKNSGASQFGAAFLLFVVTVYYAVITHKMMAVARDQLLSTTRPVIIFRLKDGTALDNVGLAVANGGSGPSLDLRIHLDQTQLPYYTASPPQPLALMAGSSVDLKFWLEPEGSVQARALKARQNLRGLCGVIAVLNATYVDVHGGSHRSKSSLEWCEPTGELQIGPTAIDQPPRRRFLRRG